jgi:hypothetical protein
MYGGRTLMAAGLYEIQDLKCPVCGKGLTTDEYKHAIEEIRLKAEQDFQEQSKRDRNEYNERIQNERNLSQEKIDNINRNHHEHIKVLKDQLAASYNQQFEDLKKSYEKLDLQRQRLSKETVDDKITEYKQKESEWKRQVVELQNESQEIKENAFRDAKMALQNELHSKDIEIRERDEQIQRCKRTIEEMKEQMSQTQPELKGEVGEQKLLDDLKEAFPEDQFSRQTRGISEGDIIQHIRTVSGTLLKIPIVYDNKEVARVTKKEIKKQQYYKDHEGTDYLLIVCPKNGIPKNIKNGILGKKEGITLVSRDIVVEVAGYLRNTIIQISKSFESKKDQETKQARIYEFITSREFCRRLESLSNDNMEMRTIQDKEEKDHQTLWKKRKEIVQRSRSTYIAIESEIDAIIQGQLPEGSKSFSADELQDDNDEDEKVGT